MIIRRRFEDFLRTPHETPTLVNILQENQTLWLCLVNYKQLLMETEIDIAVGVIAMREHERRRCL